MPAKAKPVNNVTGVAQLGSAKAARNWPSRSKIATISTSVVSLNREMNELTMPGMTSLQRLRQHDETHHPPIAEPERHRRLVLAARDRLQTAAHDFGHIGGREQHDADQHTRNSVDLPVARQEQRQHVGGEEQHRDQRHAAPELDEDDAERAHDRQRRAPPERQQDAERQRADDAGERDHQRHQEPAP